jgi:hypothetical protein
MECAAAAIAMVMQKLENLRNAAEYATYTVRNFYVVIRRNKEWAAV